MLLTMYNSIEKNTDWLKWAESALEFLKTKCVDPADGRMFFMWLPTAPHPQTPLRLQRIFRRHRLCSARQGDRQPGFCP